jgi:Domain of unknown function (DUF4232)
MTKAPIGHSKIPLHPSAGRGARSVGAFALAAGMVAAPAPAGATPLVAPAPAIGGRAAPAGPGASTREVAAPDKPAPARGIMAFGTAKTFGHAPPSLFSSPAVSLAATPDGHGYWLVTSGGGVFTFGDAVFRGSLANQHLAHRVVGIAPTADGQGYWLATTNGAVFSFGDARFHGSLGDKARSSTVDGIVATPSGQGYWLVSSGGGVFTFGDAVFRGSLGATPLSVPVVGLAPAAQGRGYWLATSMVSPVTTCKAGQLSVAYEPVESTGGAAGSVGLTYQFTNASLYACTLHGYPGFQMLGPLHSTLATHLHRRPAAGAPATVTLLPQGHAWFQIEYPTQTGYANLSCPTSASVEVTPPNDFHQVLVTAGRGAHLQPYGGTTANLQCGRISVTAVAAVPPVEASPPCTGGQLSVSERSVAPGYYVRGALGHSSVVVLFKDTSARSCTLTAYPGVAGVGANGHQVVQARRTPSGYLGGLAPQNTTPPTVLLSPATAASATVEGTDVRTGTRTSCPVLDGLLVTPPGTSLTVRVPAAPGDCSGLQVHPVVPGDTGSQGP